MALVQVWLPVPTGGRLADDLLAAVGKLMYLRFMGVQLKQPPTKAMLIKPPTSLCFPLISTEIWKHSKSTTSENLNICDVARGGKPSAVTILKVCGSEIVE